MELHLKYTNLEPSPELKIFIGDKLGFLAKLPLPAGKEVHAWIDIGRTTRHHQRGLVWYAECQIKMPGKKTIRATSTNYDLGAAMDEAKDEIELILKKTRDKYQENIRRSRKLK
jgi:ribosomal subunit interface protein